MREKMTQKQIFYIIKKENIERICKKKHPAMCGWMLFLEKIKFYVKPYASYDKSSFYIFPITVPAPQNCTLYIM